MGPAGVLHSRAVQGQDPRVIDDVLKVKAVNFLERIVGFDRLPAKADGENALLLRDGDELAAVGG